MKKNITILLSIIIVIIFSFYVTYIKLQNNWLGILFLDYLFLPISLFLIVDGIIGILKNEQYLITRTLRVIIGTSMLTIHLYTIFLL